MKICKVEKKREVIDVDYEVCGNEYCCEKMEKWLHIGHGYSRKNLNYNTGTGRFDICTRESNHGYGYSGSDDDALHDDLDFCPFCGERLQSSKSKVTAPKKRKRWGKK